jgi:hypothetical protein
MQVRSHPHRTLFAAAALIHICRSIIIIFVPRAERRQFTNGRRSHRIEIDRERLRKINLIRIISLEACTHAVRRANIDSKVEFRQRVRSAGVTTCEFATRLHTSRDPRAADRLGTLRH